MFKRISEAYSCLANEERRTFYDKHGKSPEDAENDADFTGGLDDMFNMMFGGGGGGKGGPTFTFSMDADFDDFSNILEGNDERAFKKMFRDMGKGYRGGNKAARQGRGRKNNKMRPNEMKKMDKMMKDMMFGGGKGGGDDEDDDDYFDEMEKMMDGGMAGMGMGMGMDMDFDDFEKMMMG